MGNARVMEGDFGRRWFGIGGGGQFGWGWGSQGLLVRWVDYSGVSSSLGAGLENAMLARFGVIDVELGRIFARWRGRVVLRCVDVSLNVAV